MFIAYGIPINNFPINNFTISPIRAEKGLDG